MNERVDYLSNPAVIIEAVVFIFCLGVTRAGLNAKIKDLEKRIEKIEDLDLDSRLSRMEANLDWIRSTLENKLRN